MTLRFIKFLEDFGAFIIQMSENNHMLKYDRLEYHLWFLIENSKPMYLHSSDMYDSKYPLKIFFVKFDKKFMSPDVFPRLKWDSLLLSRDVSEYNCKLTLLRYSLIKNLSNLYLIQIIEVGLSAVFLQQFFFYVLFNFSVENIQYKFWHYLLRIGKYLKEIFFSRERCQSQSNSSIWNCLVSIPGVW